MTTKKPHIAILGAGPTGLEAALAAAERDLPFTLYEARPHAAGYMRSWGHVKLFSPWELNVSERGRKALEERGHTIPRGSACPTGDELADTVLDPIAKLPAIAPHIRYATRVVAVGREGLLKHEEISSKERASRRFRLLLVDDTSREFVEHADVVFDTTGTYGTPNSLGADGIPAPGERSLGDAVCRQIPNILRDADAWAGKTTLLVGAGYSAETAVRDLADLASRRPGTRVVWAIRQSSPGFGIVDHDPLPERLSLASRAKALAADGGAAVETHTGVVVESLEKTNGHITVTLRGQGGERTHVAVDRILSLTGYVGDHTLYRQLQVHECYATSGPMKLAAALLSASGGGGDCLAQQSMGPETLKTPEPGFFILGSKSYGRNNTYLMRIGWEQVNEVFTLLGV